MFEPYTQMNPWTSGLYGTVQPYGLNAQTFFPTPLGFGFGAPTPFFGVPGIPGQGQRHLAREEPCVKAASPSRPSVPVLQRPRENGL